MDSLISIINKLQSKPLNITEEISLPQIVVVGDQSSGKSSIIENIIGKSFLPRGTGIVTRQPLILQLINIPEGERTLVEEFGVFHHKQNLIFNDFNYIREEIASETNLKAGRNKEICEEPICLNIYSRDVMNWILIDLPGLTKIPVGNQPVDIEMRVRQLVTKYISNPYSIILAVVTANTDITTNESLKLAKEIDKEGNRTVVIVTKLDIMDSGTDATDILTGKVIPVELGIIGVVNRSQEDIKTNKSISDAIRDEAVFFQKHYSAIASKHGTPYLCRTLDKIIRSHTRKCIFELKTRIGNVKAQTMVSLQHLGGNVTDASQTLLQIINAFCAAYCAALDGTSSKIEMSKLSGGARICYIFHEIFGKTLDYIQPLIGLSKYDILTAMKNSSGTRPALFVPESCFVILVKSQIERLLDPSLRCVELIHEEMQEILRSCGKDAQQKMLRFPKLLDKIINVASEFMMRRLDETNAMVMNLINIELAYINTMHPEFRKHAETSLHFYMDRPRAQREEQREMYLEEEPQSISPNCEERPCALPRSNVLHRRWFTALLPANYIQTFSGNYPHNSNSVPARSAKVAKNQLAALSSMSSLKSLSERDKQECNAIENLVSNYFNIIKKSIQDRVPKVIMHCMVNIVKQDIQRELVEVLYRSEQSQNLLEESAQIKAHREEQESILKALEDADIMLDKAREGLL